MSCATEMSIASYVLGTLDPRDQAEVADHLTRCASCRAQLEQLADLPGLLAHVPPDVAATGLPRPQQGLLDRVLAAAAAEVAQRRRRRRVLTVAAAAALVVGGGVAVSVSQDDVASVRSTTVTGAQGPVHARVQLRPAAQGTELTLELSGVAPEQECRLVAVAADGTRDIAASWRASYTGEATIRGHTAVDAARINRLVIETVDRHILVEMDVPR